MSSRTKADRALGWAVNIGCAVAVFAVALALAAVIILAFGGLAVLGDLAAWPTQKAQIEQLRVDAANVDPDQAEDVIGQVTVWNQKIAENQARNATWYFGWMTIDEWDSVELIPVPKEP